MPIRRLLADSDLSAQRQEILNRAFVRTLSVLGLVDRNDPLCEMIARTIMQVGISPEVSDPIVISEIAIRKFKNLGP